MPDPMTEDFAITVLEAMPARRKIFDEHELRAIRITAAHMRHCAALRTGKARTIAMAWVELCAAIRGDESLQDPRAPDANDPLLCPMCRLSRDLDVCISFNGRLVHASCIETAARLRGMAKVPP